MENAKCEIRDREICQIVISRGCLIKIPKIAASNNVRCSLVDNQLREQRLVSKASPLEHNSADPHYTTMTGL